MVDEWDADGVESVPMESIDASSYLDLLWNIMQLKEKPIYTLPIIPGFLKARANQVNPAHKAYIANAIEADEEDNAVLLREREGE